MSFERLRRLVFALLFTAAGTLAVSCDVVERVGNGTPAPAGVLPDPPEKPAGRKRRKAS